MRCMKCGRDIDEGQVFCGSCLEDMARYPVKPGIAIQLPSRKDPVPGKKAYIRMKASPTPEEQLRTMKRRVRFFAVLWLVTLALAAALTYPLVRELVLGQDLLPGQNYHTVVQTEAPDGT